MEDGDWLSEYDSASARGQTLMSKIAERNRSSRNSSAFIRQTTEISRLMTDFKRDIDGLRTRLALKSLSVTSRELQRREAMVDNLVTKEKHIAEAFRSDSESRLGGAALFESGSKRRSADVVGWGQDDAQDDDDTACLLSNDEIRQEQQKIIRDQDEGLDVLSKILSRQKQVGLTIGDEVDAQNEMLEDIQEGVDRTHVRISRETRNIERVDRKDKTWFLWLIMSLLLVAIVVIICIPKP